MKALVEIENASPTLTPERVLFLDSLRAIAIVMVIGVHAMDYCLPLPDSQKEIISFIVHTIPVPIFFLVDGYLFARSTTLAKEIIFIENIKKSLFRLLVPWAIFTALYTIARYFFETIGFLKEKMIIGHSLQEVMISAYGSVYAPQMYFLVSLFLIRLCGPIFIRVALVKNYFLIILFFLCYYVAYMSCITYISPYLKIEGGQEPILHALWGIQYYLSGIILFKISNVLSLKKLFLPFLLLFLVILFIRSDLGDIGFVFVQYFYLITLFIFFFLVGNRLPLFDTIGKNTMGIYLIHAPIVLKGVSLIFNEFIIIPIWNFISILFCTLFISACIVIAINYVPYGVLLFGTPYQQNKNLVINKALKRTRKMYE